MVFFTDIFKKYIIKLQYFNFEKVYPAHGFYMVTTSHSKSILTMSIAVKVCDYFENLIKPMVTHKFLENLLGAFLEKIVKRLDEKLDKQNSKITELQSKNAIQDHALQKLEIKCDNNEHYSHRLCICIHGVQYTENIT